MASEDEQLKRLTDQSLLDKIDGLRELNISEHIALPQVSRVVCERRTFSSYNCSEAGGCG